MKGNITFDARSSDEIPAERAGVQLRAGHLASGRGHRGGVVGAAAAAGDGGGAGGHEGEEARAAAAADADEGEGGAGGRRGQLHLEGVVDGADEEDGQEEAAVGAGEDEGRGLHSKRFTDFKRERLHLACITVPRQLTQHTVKTFFFLF